MAALLSSATVAAAKTRERSGKMAVSAPISDPFALSRVFAIDGSVTRVDHICREHVVIEAEVERFPPSSPGQFLELRCHTEPAESARAADWPAGGFPKLADSGMFFRDPYLRRPFSIADRVESGGKTRLSVISRSIGPGTDYLDHVVVGSTLNLSGPLGVGFRIPADDRPLLLVGGGVGIPPLLYLARRLREAGKSNITVVFGAASHDLLPVRRVAEPSTAGEPLACLALPGYETAPAVVTTDDGTLGLRGRVTDAIARIAPTLSGGVPLILACGPEPMLDALAHQSRALGWGCQLCIERFMGCGMGTCLSCCTRVVAPDRPAGWRWALACSEGPVFDRDELFDLAR